MQFANIESKAAWTVAALTADAGWRFSLDDAARAQVAAAVKAAYDPDRRLFDYTRADFDFGPAWDVIAAAFGEAQQGRGLALVQGLPREGVSEAEFELMNWAIGLHAGVARPQGKATQYISAVRDVGTDYRASTGRGYSSNAKLDFHVDGADIATLACYNTAKAGGQSMISSSLTAWNRLLAERPDLADVACRDFWFSRQQEEAPDETLAYPQPLYDTADGRVFCKWNRNRVQSAQKIDGVPPLTAAQRDCMDALDEILQRPDVMYKMDLAPGDLQIMNNHVVIHSRTAYEDFDAPDQKRLLHRLWLAPPNAVRLPGSWADFYRTAEPNTVRGGIRGHNHGADCIAFERRQAAALGMAPLY